MLTKWFLLWVMSLFVWASGLQGQAFLSLLNAKLQPHQYPQGWTLSSEQKAREILIRMHEVRLETNLAAATTQKFTSESHTAEIRYFEGLSLDDMTKTYFSLSQQKDVDLVCHKGRVAIAVKAARPEDGLEFFRSLCPSSLDRIKILAPDLRMGERIDVQILANRHQREALARQIGPQPLEVLNQFFSPSKSKQITYVAFSTIEDASKAAGVLKGLSQGSRFVQRRNYIVELAGSDEWTVRLGALIKTRLAVLVKEENQIRRAISTPRPTNTPEP